MEILDINDNTPEFVPSPSASLSTYIRHINEGPESVDSVIIDANATDKDTGTNAKILYSMSGDEHGHFQLNSTTVSLTFLIHAAGAGIPHSPPFMHFLVGIELTTTRRSYTSIPWGNVKKI